MNVTNKNTNRLYDMLLKHFDATVFIVVDSWCTIGFHGTDGKENILLKSCKINDLFTSARLFKLFNAYNYYPHKDPISVFAEQNHVSTEDVKACLVRDILYQMKHGQLFSIDMNLFNSGLWSLKRDDIKQVKDYAIFAIEYSLT